MPRATPALRLSIFLREDDTWHHKPLHHEIVHRAKAAGLAGATVLRGIEGYGATSLIHTTRLLDLAEQLPVIVVIVDTEERVRAFLTELDDVVTEATVTVDEVEILRYGKDQR
jgi:PII-like signaling protein